MTDFAYEAAYQFGPDTTEYVRVEGLDAHVSLIDVDGRKVLKVAPQALTALAERAFTDLAHLLRASHLESLAKIIKDPEATGNDRAIAHELLKNAAIAADRVLPGCQDTGTAIVVGKKGQYVWTEGGDEEALSLGAFRSYTDGYLRYSQVAPQSMFEEKNTGSNLPAQIDLYATEGNAYKFLFMAKGGGSANKTYLYQETKALLNEESLLAWADAAIRKLGTAACPPYHLAIVIGGTSAETNLKIVKMASAKELDALPETGSAGGRAFRDREWEQKILELSQKSGIGAQFGGKYFCHDVRVIRLPRHGASCPVGIGVSCSADRNVKAKITADGVFIERLETDPKRFLLDVSDAAGDAPVAIDVDRPMKEICAELSKHPVATRLALSGTIVVARDIAHAKLKARLDRGEGLPDYLKDRIVYYAGPAKTPKGMPSGSFGPTTAQRMDPYVPIFQAAGGSMVSLAKGNRSQQVVDACKKYGGFYLGSIGGPAARLAKDCIKSVEVLEFPELGMEAVWKIEIVDFPAFVVIDDKGNDFFGPLLNPAKKPLPVA
jgi:fumarate hydratase class I